MKKKIFLGDELFRFLSENIKDVNLFNVAKKDIIEYAANTYDFYINLNDVSTIEYTYMNIRFSLDVNTRFCILNYKR